jgi:RNA polymerase sigma factor (sigma-70 family)
MSWTMSEVELVRLVKSFLSKPEKDATEGEALAFKELYRECGRIVRRRLGGKHHGWTDDDNLFQLVWVILIQRLRKLPFDPARDTLEGWIDRIVRDVIGRHDHHFSKRREQAITPAIEDTLLDAKHDLDREVAPGELREELQSLIESLRPSLSDRDRAIVSKRWIEGRTVAEIADELHLTPDCVTSALYRIGRRLTTLIRRRDRTPSVK